MDSKVDSPKPLVDEQPDIQLIDLLCSEVLTNFSINKTILYNWQAELSDCSKNGSLLTAAISEEVILSFPQRKIYFSQPNKDSLVTVLKDIDRLEDAVYYDFKLLIFELLIQTTSFSYTAKVQLYRLKLLPDLLTDIIQHAEREEYKTKEGTSELIVQKSRLLVGFFELGCGVQELHSLFLPLLGKSSRIKTRTKMLLLDVLYSTFSQNPYHFTFFIFNSFVGKQIPFPLMDDLKSSRCFSVSAWFKVNEAICQNGRPEEISVTSLISFANASDSKSSVLKIQLVNYKQFMVEIHNVRNGSRMQFTFNHIIDPSSNENESYTHFALTYDQHKNLNLFIDGEYSESIPCTSLCEIMNSWNKVYIGHSSDSDEVVHNAFNRDELLLKDLFILNSCLSYEWITTFFCLGLDYNWRYKDFSKENIANLINHLSHKSSVALELRINEIINSNSRARFSKFRPSHQSVPIRTSTAKNARSGLVDKSAIVTILWKSIPKKSDIRFDSSEAFFTEQIENSPSQDVLVHQSESIHGALYCLGGSGLLLTLIEVLAKSEYDTSRARNQVFLKTIDLLLVCLSKNWRLNKEFENCDGYEILALLICYFKDNFNPNLVFEAQTPDPFKDGLPDSSGLHFERYQGLLQRFLAFVGCRQGNEQESMIFNPVAYKSLVLKLDFYLGTSDYDHLHEHLRALISEGKFAAFNMKQLCNMKLLRRLVQHIKLQLLGENTSHSDLEQSSATLNMVIRHDVSVETIRSMSRFVIFSLFHISDEKSKEIGVSTLRTLTEELCKPSCSIKSLKKFSRSITIHWLLLLLSYENDSTPLANRIVYYTLESLEKLLKVLGPHIIKRFFHGNNGLDVLTHFLRNWWNNDQVACVLLQASFGADIPTSPSSNVTLVQLVQDEALVKKSNKLMMPEFLLILNNMALTGMYILSSRHGKILSVPSSPLKGSDIAGISNDETLDIGFDALKLIDQYSEMIEVGYENSIALENIFFSKEWLEGSFELLGQLQLSLTWLSNVLVQDFKACTDKFVSVLSKIFISKILKVKELLDMLKSLSDITTKIALNYIFPRVFQHINEFMGNSQFIFDEKNFLDGALELINYYHAEFIEPNFSVSSPDLEVFINCVVSVLETISGNEKNTHVSEKLGNILGIAIILKLSLLTYNNIGTQEGDEEGEVEFAKGFDENVKFILLKQAIFAEKGAISDNYLAQIFELLMGNFLKLSTEKQLLVAEHFLNFLRTSYLMRQESFGKVVEQLCTLTDYPNASDIVLEFFSGLTTRNDEEIIRQLQKFPTIKYIFNKNYHFRVSKLRETGDLKVMDMIAVMLNNGGRLGYLNTGNIKGFERDCETLKTSAINSELTSFNRDLSDVQENDAISISLFNSMKIEISRSFFDSFAKSSDYILDYIEGVDRMRKLLVVEAQLAESEKLSYNVSIPLKPISTANSDLADFDDCGYMFANSGADEINLSDISLAGLGIEDYDEIEDVRESNENNNRSVYEDRNRKVLRSLYMGDQIQSLWNVSRVNGLDAVESLMILGSSHVYLIENYFHSADGNVVDVDEASPDERDPYLQLIKPQTKGKNGYKSHRVSSWSLETLGSISKRKFLLRDIALEMFFDDGASILLTCLSSKQRDSVHNSMSPYATKRGLDKDLASTLEASSNFSQSSQSSYLAGFFSTSRIAAAFSQNFNPSTLSATKKWRLGEMSNFYYLMTLNTMAGRTFNDLTQYPVFPWVIADYESDELDLSDPKSFRDLSKPMGAQTSSRAREFQERFEVLSSLNDENTPAFHYGTHYSSAMIVSSYLIRLKPYVQSYLLLQGGKFDHAERLFNSIEKAWNSASRDNTTDIRELTPEFFYLPEFLTNINNFEFGKLQNGESIGDVALPKWAKGDPKIFIAKNREALESPYVSANLHKWIDLIFGFKQTGQEAIEALNVFHHSSYEGAVNLDNIKDDVEKRAVIGMINNFGQTPVRLFSKPHPPREILNIPNLYLSLIDVKRNVPYTSFESKLNLPISKLEISAKTNKWIGRPHCVSSEDDLLIRKPSPSKSKFDCSSLIINTTLFSNLHSGNISTLMQIGNKRFITGSSDGAIHVWKCALKPTMSVSYQHTLRGHFSGIKSFHYSKTFKVCLSVDTEGCMILWDFTRFKFVRKITPPVKAEHPVVLAAISNDTGNICTITNTLKANILTLYTINGDIIVQKEIDMRPVSALSIASFNDSLVNSPRHELCHNYWSSEMIFICYATPTKCLQVHELTVGANEWKLALLQEVALESHVKGTVSCIQALKMAETDHEEKLNRGRFLVVVGDSAGCVYIL